MEPSPDQVPRLMSRNSGRCGLVVATAGGAAAAQPVPGTQRVELLFGSERQPQSVVEWSSSMNQPQALPSVSSPVAATHESSSHAALAARRKAFARSTSGDVCQPGAALRGLCNETLLRDTV